MWTPDSEHIVFASRRDQGNFTNLYWQRANGTGPVLRLTESALPQVPFSIHPSGKYLAFVEGCPRVGQALDIKILPLESDGKGGLKPGSAWTFLGTAANENQPAFSPDGRWLAYTSYEGGTDNRTCSWHPSHPVTESEGVDRGRQLSRVVRDSAGAFLCRARRAA